jgi:hypothetical protein
MASSSKDRHGKALIAGVVVIFIALFVVAAVVKSEPKPDAEGCVGMSAGDTVIVLDHSEKISDQTKSEISARALAFVTANTKVNDRVTVFNVDDLSRKSLVPVFSRCKPPATGNQAYQSVKGVERSYREQFLEPLTKALSAAPSNGKESPIAQALIDVSLTHYLRGSRNALLIYSDMLEYTPKFSMYTCSDGQHAISQLRDSRRGAQERPKFENADIEINMIPRSDIPRPTLKCRDQVWAWFFGDNQGADAKLNVDYLPGG